jgi:RNA polymerase sigma-70 factor (ECF subfamily)
VNPLRRLRAVPDPPGASPDPDGRAAALMARAAHGDQGAFAELYDVLAGLVHGIVLRVVRDPAQSEEVTQEVMVELWRHAPRYDPATGSVRGLAATMAHRRAVDRVRSEHASRARQDRVGRLHTAEVDTTAEAVEDRLERDQVARALDSLTPLQRQTVELAYYGGHTYREVAALLHVPEGTVKTRIRDGLIRLRDTMGIAP